MQPRLALTAPDPDLVCTGRLTAGRRAGRQTRGTGQQEAAQGQDTGQAELGARAEPEGECRRGGVGGGHGLRGGGHCSGHGATGQGDGPGKARASAGDSGNASNLEAAFKNMTLFKDRHCPLMQCSTESCFISVPLTSKATLPRRTKSCGKPRRNGGRKRSPTEMPPTSPRAIGIGQAGLPHRRGSPTSSQDSDA